MGGTLHGPAGLFPGSSIRIHPVSPLSPPLRTLPVRCQSCESQNPTAIRASPRGPLSTAADGEERASCLAARGPGEEIIPLVVDDDERGEVAHLDLPDRLHPRFWVLQHVDLGDAVLRQFCRDAADRA